MKILNEIAEEYTNKILTERYLEIATEVKSIFAEPVKEDFIAGATSSYVEAEKLKFAIETLEKLIRNNGDAFLINEHRELILKLKEIEK